MGGVPSISLEIIKVVSIFANVILIPKYRR